MKRVGGEEFIVRMSSEWWGSTKKSTSKSRKKTTSKAKAKATVIGSSGCGKWVDKKLREKKAPQNLINTEITVFS